MADNIITYETLYDILRKEKYNQELQKLDNDFFERVLKYLKKLAYLPLLKYKKLENN